MASVIKKGGTSGKVVRPEPDVPCWGGKVCKRGGHELFNQTST